ncbi:hypothetical protein OO007_18945 [Cocleimonas sp. KMM 6892]|uniref:hypothetical protein n=1 Tax=unclassified Cocleimonas TaxID=2639732 RepID=UPI002DBDCCF8|nr:MULTISPECIES: hypothetical protein [unclassified Cocleimonas]MEB8434323.1 hypothetical protein [Cocleimonas sp. KMM 6892]MEC4717274.1 hypothetical protein [Cocleimonas sp. KMM 6895]MEC4746653.1 hypothetical protein [Cocleimonas sp. KMM 6896]
MLEQRWKACITAILLICPYAILIMIVYGVETGFSSDADNPFLNFIFVVFKWIVAILIGLTIYLFISLLGWLFIGMPISKIIEKSQKPNILMYLGVSIFVCLIVGLFVAMPNASFSNDVRNTAFFGIPIILQSVAYKFYLNKIMSHEQ